ncbi:MAG: MgtC/SapB family protein [Cypionkella sp.]
MPQIDTFSRLAAALAIGLMVGMERGWQSRDGVGDSRAAGLRTFGLSGLMGGICGLLSATLGTQIVGFAFVAFTAAFGAFSWLEAKAINGVSATTLIAGMLTFLLGTLAVVGDVTIAIAAAVSMTVLLALRTQLHSWIATVTWQEIRAALILMVMSFLLLPVLPDRTIDPWNTVNLHEVWLLAIMMALISFMGYIAVRIFGDKLGIIVTAAAGGLASSTATTLTLARLGRDQPGAVNLLSGGIMISGAIMAVRVGVIASILNPALLPLLLLPLATAFLTMAMMAGIYVLVIGGKKADTSTSQLAIKNPLEVATSLKLAAFIVVVMLAAELVQRAWGAGGVLAVAAMSGVADVDAITLSMARMTTQDQLATQAILLAVAVNTASKATMAAWFGGLAVGLRVWLASAMAIAAAGATFFWFG